MKPYAWIVGFICVLCSFAAPARGGFGDSAQDDFFARAKLIMSKFEIEIYTHLATAADRDEFIADFWKKRDPSPGSEENEFKDDFDKRVEFANRWFNERGPGDSGWDSDRGRILLMLGFPDQREQMPMLNQPRIKAAEIWTYQKFFLRLEFIDQEGVGQFRLEQWPLELLDAIEQVKQLGEPAGNKNYFRFKVVRDDAGLVIEIPLQAIVLEERGDAVRTAFAITADVYCDYVKLERLTLTREFVQSRAEFTARKSIIIAIPYSFPKAGKYFLDVVVEELVSGQRSREFVKFKRTGKK